MGKAINQINQFLQMDRVHTLHSGIQSNTDRR